MPFSPRRDFLRRLVLTAAVPPRVLGQRATASRPHTVTFVARRGLRDLGTGDDLGPRATHEFTRLAPHRGRMLVAAPA